MNAKITLPELVEQISEATNTTQRMSELFLRELLATVTETLVAGESVSIKDLGTFKLQKADGDARQLLFSPAKKLAETLNQPFEAFVPVELDDDVTEQALAQAGGTPPVMDSEPVEASNQTDQTDSAESSDQSDLSDQSVVSDQPDVSDQFDVLEHSNPSDTSGQSTPSESSEPLHPEPVTTAMLVQSQAFPDAALLDQVRREVAREAAHTALWKGLAIGLVAGVLVATLMMRILQPAATGTTTTADSQASPDTTAVADVPTRQAATPPPVVTDTISATMYLTKMAIKHYGRQEFWVYIYEENKSLIGNPNHIKPGTVMVIPPAEKYGINPADPASVAQAEKRSIELFNKYKF